MTEDLINFDLPRNKSSIIKVIGVGGGGSNAVNQMFRQGIEGVDFIVCNTDAQALINSPVPTKIQLGSSLTEGLGAGNKPDIGMQAATESIQDIVNVLRSNTKMVFITAGMGGGTGTGAAPVIAKATKEMGILTVAIVTIPFRFEGTQRINHAIEGINELTDYVDSLLVINNEKLREIYGDQKLSEAFSKADNVLTTAAKGIAEIITVHGYMNVDFADVKTVMSNSGVSIMGSASAEGENRAVNAIQQALNSPLLNNNDIKGAKNILLNITSGAEEISMDEIYDITDYLTNSVAKDVNIIWGTGIDHKLENKINVTVIATGFEANSIPELYARNKKVSKVPLKEGQTVNRIVSSGFELKNKTIVKKEGNPVFQRSIEFDNTGSSRQENDFELKSNSQRGVESIKPMDRDDEPTSPNMKEMTIDDLENQPAFARNKIKMSELKFHSDNSVSRYTLSEDEDKQIKLRPDNSFLHDNVD